MLQLDYELNQLINMDKLKKKIITLNFHCDKLQEYKRYCINKDDMILTKRRLIKAKQLVLKYLEILKQDTQFSISIVDNICYIMNYKGNYVFAQKSGYIEIDGVLK